MNGVGLTTTFEDVAAREREFQLATYQKFAFAPERGRGAWVETAAGERFLDLYGGHAVCATGHCHPRVVAAIKEQSERLLFYSNVVYSEVRGSDKLLKLVVNFGDHRRNILAGMKQERADPREVEGRQALFVVNLEPRRMAGEVSEGMLFDLGYADGLAPALAVPERELPDGARAG